MLETPFRYEPTFTPEEFQKLGQLTLRWSHIEHIVGNCLRHMLRLSDEEAILIVFPMSLEQRMNRIHDLAKLAPLPADAQRALAELNGGVKAIQFVRGHVVHAVVMGEPPDEIHLELRSKKRKLTKKQIFDTEEITNYAAHAALAFRFALGLKDGEDVRWPLPDRPAVPAFLPTCFPTPPAQKTAARKARRKSSPG
jgi:hypothetical protein